VRARLEADGDRVIGVDLRDADVNADLSTVQGRADAVAAVARACDDRLDRLVLCAGIGGHVADLRVVPSVNYFGAVEVLDGLADVLAAGTDPAVVVITSNSAQFAPFAEHPYVLALLEGDETKARELIAGGDGFTAYSGSKHALTRAVRRRAQVFGARAVRLNAVAPGPTMTPLLQATFDDPVFGDAAKGLELPLGRFGEPVDVANLVAFLLGGQAGWIHGSVHYVDGGNDASWRPDAF
jgi:NAD(P)-dependent dehydrogenase (short-subunit alcohol dehydrogenase family)